GCESFFIDGAREKGYHDSSFIGTWIAWNIASKDSLIFGDTLKLYRNGKAKRNKVYNDKMAWSVIDTNVRFVTPFKETNGHGKMATFEFSFNHSMGGEPVTVNNASVYHFSKKYNYSFNGMVGFYTNEGQFDNYVYTKQEYLNELLIEVKKQIIEKKELEEENNKIQIGKDSINRLSNDIKHEEENKKRKEERKDIWDKINSNKYSQEHSWTYLTSFWNSYYEYDENIINLDSVICIYVKERGIYNYPMVKDKQVDHYIWTILIYCNSKSYEFIENEIVFLDDTYKHNIFNSEYLSPINLYTSTLPTELYIRVCR
ncbi:MAG: hypothetical protein K8I03_11635, partial [Ignavibacteria bacterium]|nr:hypothetical protein [Ignavibacteria bacterium]